MFDIERRGLPLWPRARMQHAPIAHIRYVNSVCSECERTCCYPVLQIMHAAIASSQVLYAGT